MFTSVMFKKYDLQCFLSRREFVSFLIINNVIKTPLKMDVKSLTEKELLSQM